MAIDIAQVQIPVLQDQNRVLTQTQINTNIALRTLQVEVVSALDQLLGLINSSGFSIPISIADGGTGKTTANDAINALLPDQTGNANKVLQTDGLNTSWFAVPSVTTGNLIDSGTDGIVITNGINAVFGSGTSIAQHVADSSHNGYLSSADWSSFNSKEPAGSTIQNQIWVDTAEGSDSNSGSAIHPLQTISAAMTKIGSATNATDFNVDATARYLVHIAPGLYTENVTIPKRQYIELGMSGATIVGNVTFTLDQNLLTGTIKHPKLVFKGDDLRNAYDGSGYPITGIQGDVSMSSVNSGANNGVIELLQTGVVGNLQCTSAVPALFFLSDSIVTGTIGTVGAGGQVTLYIENCDTSSSKAIGAVSGFVLLNILRNVRFNGAVVVGNTQAGARWFNTEFKSGQAHDFTGSTGAISADANSLASFNSNVPTKGGVTFTRLDDAYGVGYTPATPGNWSVVPTYVSGALDTLAVSAASAISGLTGDVSASGPGVVAATVNSVGGSSAANVHSAELAANAATSANTASTIVARDASGNFSAGAVNFVNKLQHNGSDWAVQSGSGSSENFWLGQGAPTSLTTGTGNTLITTGAANNSITSGSNNTLIGNAVMPALTTGGSNLAIGWNIAPTGNGAQNMFLGSSIATANGGGKGERNVGIGFAALGNLGGALSTTGAHNVAIGYNSCSSVTSGAGNTCIGYQAGTSNFTGSNNVEIGINATLTGSFSNSTALGANTTVGASNSMVLGNGVNVGIDSAFSTTPSARLSLPGGTATAKSAPLKIAAGTLMTTPEPGAIESDGTHLYWTDAGGTRLTII